MKTDANVYAPRQQVIAAMGPLTSENVDEIVGWHNRTVSSTWEARKGPWGASIHRQGNYIDDAILASGEYLVLIYRRDYYDPTKLIPQFIVMGWWFTEFFESASEATARERK